MPSCPVRSRLAAGLLLLGVLLGLHCNVGPISPPPNDGDDDDTSDLDADGDGDTDADTDADGDVACVDEADQYPGELHCRYATWLFGQSCYEYAGEVSLREAEADCAVHRQGGSPSQNSRFGEGPCDLDATGYCFYADQTPCGREHTISGFTDRADCNPTVIGSSAWVCETLGRGVYTCTLDLDAGADAGR